MDRVNLERSIAIYVAAPTYAAYTSLCLVYEPAQPHPQLPNPKDMRSAKALTCVDLFAGCGGLSLGLERAGFDTVLFSELNADAAATFRANRASRDLLEFGDVTQLLKKGVIDGVKHKLRERAEPVKRIDLLCGGPPCQGYSGIGHRRTHAVERQEIPSNHL
ncbi:MAG TPA: DNA cytosine methyltransferase, partial [Gemmatimonadaceae bacterium]